MLAPETFPDPARRVVMARGRGRLDMWRALRRSPPEGFQQIASFGDLAMVQLARRGLLMVSHPAYIQSVLVQQNQSFVKGRALQLGRHILGQGLLTSEGAFWRRQRQLSQPTFARHQVEDYVPQMTALTLRQMAEWHTGDSLDLARELVRLTLSITTSTLFGVDVDEAADAVRADLTWLMRELHGRIRSLVPIPAWLPTRSRFERDAAVSRLDAIIYRIIDSHSQDAGAHAGQDLLARLMHATDANGQGMSRRQLRDEVMTVFLAGHDTTANALAWTWYSLMQQPSALTRLQEELDRVLQGRVPGLDDLDRLPFNRAVVAEGLRLYPPAWILLRRATAAFQLGDETFPAGTQVAMSQWVTHRDPRFWSDPNTFRPERWLGEGPHIPPFAYFPFGAGPRLCIGRSFALLEAELILALMAQQVSFTLEPSPAVEVEALITIRPRNGIPVTVVRRSPAT